MKSMRMPVFAGLILLSPVCMGAVYFGAGMVASEYDYTDVSRGTGPRFIVGYAGENLPLMFEVEYLDLGEAKIDNFVDPGTGVSLSNGALGFKGGNFSLGYRAELSPAGSAFYAKVGYYTGDATLDGNLVPAVVSLPSQEKASGLSFGLGGDWMFSSHVGLRFEIGSLLDIKDLPQLDPSHKSNVTTYGLALMARFGGKPAQQALAPVYTPVARAPAPYTPPAPVAMPPPPPAEPVAAPPPAPAPVMAAAAPVPPVVARRPVAVGPQARPDAVIRSQPTPKGSVSLILTAGGPVELVSRLDTANGSWWLVRGGGIQGWIKQDDLVPGSY